MTTPAYRITLCRRCRRGVYVDEAPAVCVVANCGRMLVEPGQRVIGNTVCRKPAALGFAKPAQRETAA